VTPLLLAVLRSKQCIFGPHHLVGFTYEDDPLATWAYIFLRAACNVVHFVLRTIAAPFVVDPTHGGLDVQRLHGARVLLGPTHQNSLPSGWSIPRISS
jgi:hypothetical protein